MYKIDILCYSAYTVQMICAIKFLFIGGNLVKMPNIFRRKLKRVHSNITPVICSIILAVLNFELFYGEKKNLLNQQIFQNSASLSYTSRLHSISVPTYFVNTFVPQLDNSAKLNAI